MIKMDIGPIRKLLMFTDLHFGARNNSDQHNLDNLDYIDWFIERAKDEKPSHIAFLGDFFENRNAINVRTLDYANEACRRLDALGIPIIFLVGNHDLYHRSNRKIFSTSIFKDKQNFIVVSEPVELNKDWYAAPFLFRDEYPQQAAEINAHKYILGHFEFRGFVVTGATRTLDHGPDALMLTGPEYIFSGHFHKRQYNGNIVYIGNTFPTNYGDASDNQRGCAVFDVENNDVYFHDWDNAPLFFKTRLSTVLNGEMGWPEKSRVRCTLDVDLGYSDVQALREEMVKMFSLREFTIDEDAQVRKGLLTDGLELETELDMSTLDSSVRQLISEGVQASATIDPQLLISIYDGIQL
jgi:predicted MPP superfamily phosphohydrolase